jgi:hypothetical protein
LPSATGGVQGLTVELARAGVPALIGAAVYFLVMRRQGIAEFDALVASVVNKSRLVLRLAG